MLNAPSGHAFQCRMRIQRRITPTARCQPFAQSIAEKQAAHLDNVSSLKEEKHYILPNHIKHFFSQYSPPN
jgi:hypothetical protein